MGDIIVTANVGSIDAGNAINPSGITGPGTQAMRFEAIKRAAAQKKNVTHEADASDQDIIVIGKRLKEEALDPALIQAALPTAGTVVVPCIGTINLSELASILSNLKFNVTNQNYGAGRGGENLVGAGSSMVPVNINKDVLRGYAALGGGLDYLVYHEVAHALAAMQQYNKQQFDAYKAGAGAGLTADQRKQMYPDSAEFKANEARANSIARDLAKKQRNKTFDFTPTNGYANC